MSGNNSSGESSVNEAHVTYKKLPCSSSKHVGNTNIYLNKEKLGNKALEDDEYGIIDAELDEMIVQMYDDNPNVEEAIPGSSVSQLSTQRPMINKPIWLRKYLQSKYTRKRTKEQEVVAMMTSSKSTLNAKPNWKEYRARQAIRNNARKRRVLYPDSSVQAETTNKQ